MEFIEGVWRSVTSADILRNQSGFEDLLNRFGMARRYISTYSANREDPGIFESVKTYCMFAGHARSGGSLVGALLDAHPHVILADEVDVLKYIPAGFTRDQIFRILLERSRFQANRGKTKPGRDGQSYSYQVPGQWQGRFSKLLVIGDRKAGKTAQRLGRDPSLVDKLMKIMGDVQVKVVHTVRNPYDTLSTMYIRSGRPIPTGIDLYFSNCAAIRRLQERIPTGDLLSLKHEAFLQNPTGYLKQLCDFLCIPAEPDYIQSCASILYKNPAKSRQKVDWRPEWIQAVKAGMGEFEFLHGYSFEE
jgi:hypothetical protein